MDSGKKSIGKKISTKLSKFIIGKSNKGASSSRGGSSSKLLPRVRYNTEDFTHVNETDFVIPEAVDFDSDTQLDHETLERLFGNFNEDIEEEVEEDLDDETKQPTPTFPATAEPPKEEVEGEEEGTLGPLRPPEGKVECAKTSIV